MKKDKKSFWKKIKDDLPWNDFITGLFIPLNILYLLLYLEKPFPAIIFSSAWCFLILIISYIKSRRLAIFSLITVCLILINFATSFLQSHRVLYLIVNAVDNSFWGLLFLGSLLTRKPFILTFVPRKALEEIPEKIRESSYYMRAWSIITAVWGIIQLSTTGIEIFLKAIKSPFTEIVNYCLSWPVILFLLLFSVWFPGYYWRKNWKKIEAESQKEH